LPAVANNRNCPSAVHGAMMLPATAAHPSHKDPYGTNREEGKLI